MVHVFTTANGMECHEPPYTEEEEMAIYRAIGGATELTMTSVTRPSNTTTPPVSTPADDPPPAEPRK